MDEEILNRLVALEEGRLTGPEKEAFLEFLASTPDARELLCIPSATETADSPPSGIPFPVTAFLRAGVCDGFLFPDRLEGTAYTPHLTRVEEIIRFMSGGRLQICLNRRLELVTPPSTGFERLTLQFSKDFVTIRPRLSHPHDLRGYVEVWQEGSLILGFTAVLAEEEEVPRIPPEGCFWIRTSNSSEGLGISIRPVAFEKRHWISAALTCVLRGEFTEAARILKEKPLPSARGAGRKADLLERIGSRLEALPLFSSVEGLVLTPIPAVRTRDPKISYRIVLRPVWTGAVACWKELERVRTPWTPEGETDLRDALFLPEEVREFVGTLARLTEGDLRPPIRTGMDEDPRTAMAWAAINGWVFLARGDYEEALASFESVPTPEEDWFDLKAGIRLTRHLLICKQPNTSIETKEESTIRLWEELLEGIVRSPD